VLGVGQKILVEITKIDDRGKLSLAPVLADEAETHGRDAHSQGPSDPAEGADA
jgi:polyribonucleotide nucleotidyltransferase